MAFLNLIRYKNLLIIIVLQYLLRYGLLLPILSYYGIDPVLPDYRFLLMVVATVFLAASGYVINDYFDIRIDRINRPEKVLVGREFQRRTVMLFHVIFTFIGVLSGFVLAYFTRKETYILMFVFIPVLLWLYSTTLKRQVLIGNLVISLLTALVPYFVVSLEFASLAKVYGSQVLTTTASYTAWFWVTGFAFFAFICNLGREIIKDLEDIKGDKIAGCKTLPIVMGISNTKLVVIGLSVLSIAALWALFFSIPEIRGSSLSLYYFILFLTFPFLILIWRVSSAKQPSHFFQASQASKVIMLFGILYTLVARTFFV